MREVASLTPEIAADTESEDTGEKNKAKEEQGTRGKNETEESKEIQEEKETGEKSETKEEAEAEKGREGKEEKETGSGSSIEVKNETKEKNKIETEENNELKEENKIQEPQEDPKETGQEEAAKNGWETEEKAEEAEKANRVNTVPLEQKTEHPLRLQWELDELPEKLTSGEYEVTAALPEGYVLAEGARALTLTVRVGSALREVKETITQEALNKYRQNDVSPSNVRIDLFDYWLEQRESDDSGVIGSGVTDFGINKGHKLYFRKNENGMKDSWNQYTGTSGGARTGIVKALLGNRPGEDGFPTMTQDKGGESLAYLFGPETENSYRAAYTDVGGLLQIDEAGRYFYNSNEFFAEFNEDADGKSGDFALYGKPGAVELHSTTEAEGISDGQFFPFNKGTTVYRESANENGAMKLEQNGVTSDDAILNHYFGMMMETSFYQPDGGKIPGGSDDGEDMTFYFAGDDDVWIYIDGVLVADLGGVHDQLVANINFSTGEIVLSRYDKKGGTDGQGHLENSTLREAFARALESSDMSEEEQAQYLEANFRITEAGTDKGTFRSGTQHTLKIFYLERGNYASNLQLSYNLVPPRANDLVKMDQDGEVVEGARFALYQADENYAVPEGAEPVIADIRTDENGVWEMKDELGIPYDFSKISEETGMQTYVLRETAAPAGYRLAPEVHLRYDERTGLLQVQNQWQSGAVSNFAASLYQTGGGLRYELTDGTVDANRAKRGMVLAVPLIKIDDVWMPMYGSNLHGFDYIEPQSAYEEPARNTRQAVLEAALHQLFEAHEGTAEAWYLAWSEQEDRYQGELLDLPGMLERYYLSEADTDADLAMAYYFVAPEMLGTAGTETASASEKIAALRKEVEALMTGGAGEDALTAAVHRFAQQELENFRQLNMANFRRVYSTHLYIPDIYNELRVSKVDEQGEALAGAGFALYESREAAEAGSGAVASGVTDAEGMLLFSPKAGESSVVQDEAGADGERGISRVTLETGRTYYLKETAAPEGYEANGTVTAVRVTQEGIYADAGTADDGVSVLAGIGKLYDHLVRYASEGKVNLTLRDLIAHKETSADGTTWKTENPAENYLHLHYGADGAPLEYGLDSDSQVTVSGMDGGAETKLPVFETQTGYVRLAVGQRYPAHQAQDDPYHSKANTTDLTVYGNSLGALFTGSVTIQVENRKKEDPDKPTDPEEPENPDKPTDPEEPEEPTDPEEPDEPGKPTEPEKPTEPGEPNQPTEPERPTDPGEPNQPTEPGTSEPPEKPTTEQSTAALPTTGAASVQETAHVDHGTLTGDDSQLRLWMAVLAVGVVGAAGVGGVIVWKRKRR